MSVRDIPLDKAELLALILEALLYGFSLFMFAGSIWALSSQRSTRRMNYRMLAVACFLFLFSTMHFVIDIIRIMKGFIMLRGTDARIRYFSDVSHWTFVSKNFLYAAQTLIGDGVVLYRCYAVWTSTRVMILPTLLWIAVGVTGFGCPFVEAQLKQGNVFEKCLVRWITSFWASTLTTNIVTTVLLGYRIWYVDRMTTTLCDHRKSELRPILLIIVDAGTIYSITLFAALICYVKESNAQYVILDMIMPIISITFYMVIIRVGLAKRANQPTHPNLLVHVSSAHSLSGEPRSRVQINLTRANQVENGRRASMRDPVSIENKHRSQVKFEDCEEEV